MSAARANLPLEARLHEIGPLHGNRPGHALVIEADHATACDIGVLADPSEPQPSQRVERVQDTDEMLSLDGKACSSELGTNASSGELFSCR